MAKKIKVYQSSTGSRGTSFDNCRMYDSTSARRSLMIGSSGSDRFRANMDRLYGDPDKYINKKLKDIEK